MGMTDLQFKAYLRSQIDALRKIAESTTDEDTRKQLEGLIRQYESVIAD